MVHGNDMAQCNLVVESTLMTTLCLSKCTRYGDFKSNED